MFEDDMSYLRRFDPNIALISPGQAGTEIPESWQQIFTLPNDADQISSALSLWPQVAEQYLPETYNFLKENTKAIRLANFGGRVAILYGMQTGAGRNTYYAGGNPLDVRWFPSLAPLWNRLPQGVYDFYARLHSGFYYYPSEDGGPSPLNQIFVLGENDWGILDDLEEPLRINLDTTVALFANGGGSYVAYDYENQQTVVWSSSEPPYYHDSFWGVVDAWTTISMGG